MSRTGVRLRAFLARWFGARSMELFIDPVLADLQAEYEQAARDGRRWRARWIQITGHVALAKVLLWHEGRRMLLGSPTPALAARSEPRRALAAGMAAALIATLLSVVFTFAGTDATATAPLLVLLVPQALPLSIPLGLVFGLLWSSRFDAARAGLSVAAIALACSAASFVLLARVVPEANQTFRVRLFAAAHPDLRLASPPRGAHELTLGQLRQFIASGAGAGPAAPPPDGPRALERVYYGRWALACAPLVFSAFTFAVMRRWRTRRGRVAAVAGGGGVAYLTLLVTLQSDLADPLPAIAGAWVPNATLLLAALAIRTLAPQAGQLTTSA